MNYFRQSLLSLPSYIPSDHYRLDLSLFSLDDILNEPVLPQDRRDLNRIYEQADISTKRNSIITMNNKKQKKLMNNAIAAPSLHLPNKSHKNDSHPPQYQILGRQNAFFQQVNPTDVDKTPDQNIFDYRLHLKLARGQQIFKVEQVKRKTKKRNIAGKECECCGKEVMKNHRCQNTLCDLKCGKVIENSIKKSHNKKDLGSSISDSKDENWSDENLDQEKTGKGGHLNRRQSDKKSKLNRRQSSSSNKDPFNQPSQLLLASIQKLLTAQHNTFTYRVLQLKDYQSSQSDQQNRQNFDLEKDLDLDDFDNKRLYADDEMREDDNEEKMEEEQKEEKEEKKDVRRYGFVRNEGMEEERRQQQDSGVMMGHTLLLSSGNYTFVRRQASKALGGVTNQKVQTNDKKQKKQIESNTKNQQVHSEKKVPQAQQTPTTQQGSQPTQTQSRSQSTNQQQKNLQTTELQSLPKILIDMSRLPPSQSQSQSQKNRELDQQPEVAPIHINSDGEKLDVNDLESSSQQIVDQVKGSNDQSSKRIQQNQNLAIPSVPDLQQQNSLDEQIDDIIDPHLQPNLSTNSYTHKYHGHSPYSESPQKLSKKQSKKIKVIEKKILMSQQIQDIDPISDLEEEDQRIEKGHQEQEQNEDDEKGLGKGKGRGKGRGMGRGKGIFEEELDIYQEKSQLLQDEENNIQVQQQADSQQQEEQNKSYNHRARKFPKIQHIISQPTLITPNQCPSPTSHPLTPKRQIPNMQKIIKQIQIESLKQTYEKGLGRGKVFGRGLGVLEQAEELEKEVEEEGGEIGIFDVREIGPRKRVKLTGEDKPQEKRKGQKYQQDKGYQKQRDPLDQQLCDKFQQLIEQDQLIVPQTMNLNKSLSIDKLQALYYKHYLQKRQSIAVGPGTNYQRKFNDQDQQMEDDPQQEQEEEHNLKEFGSENMENMANDKQGQIGDEELGQARQLKGDSLSDEEQLMPNNNDINSQRPNQQQQFDEILSHQEEQLESMINLENHPQDPSEPNLDQ